MRSAKEAWRTCKKVHTLVRYVSRDMRRHMQEGSFAAMPNVSGAAQGPRNIRTPAEIKNLIFLSICQAIHYESHAADRAHRGRRQGGARDAAVRFHKDETRSMRSKEEGNDYRTFRIPICCRLESMSLHEAVRALAGVPDQKGGAFRPKIRTVGLPMPGS